MKRLEILIFILIAFMVNTFSQNVYVNDKPVGSAKKNPPTNEFCAPSLLQWIGVEIPANAKIRVESNSYSNSDKEKEAVSFSNVRFY